MVQDILGDTFPSVLPAVDAVIERFDADPDFDLVALRLNPIDALPTGVSKEHVLTRGARQTEIHVARGVQVGEVQAIVQYTGGTEA